MKQFTFFIVFLVSVSAVSTEVDEALRGRYEAYLNGVKVSSSLSEKAKQLEYVFVGGHRNAQLRLLDYFGFFKRELVKHLGSDNSLHVVLPPSAKTVEENSRGYVREALSKIAENSEKKLLIIAHSRGALEVLLDGIERPEWYRRHVARVVSLQGCLLGSEVSDFTLGKEASWKSKVTSRTARLLRADSDQFDGTMGLEPGTRSLLSPISKQRWRVIKEKNKDALTDLASVVLFVQTSATRVSLLIRGSQRFYSEAFPETKNDGVLLTQNQVWKYPGFRSVELEGWDHLEVLIRAQFTDAKARARNRALLWAVVEDISNSELK